MAESLSLMELLVFNLLLMLDSSFSMNHADGTFSLPAIHKKTDAKKKNFPLLR